MHSTDVDAGGGESFWRQSQVYVINSTYSSLHRWFNYVNESWVTEADSDTESDVKAGFKF